MADYEGSDNLDGSGRGINIFFPVVLKQHPCSVSIYKPIPRILSY